MKNIKTFFALTTMIISFTGNACENSDSKALIPVERIDSRELAHQVFDNDSDEPRINVNELFNNCYSFNDPQACQRLIAFAAYTIMSDRAKYGDIIFSQEKTISSLRETLDLINEREKTRVEK